MKTQTKFKKKKNLRVQEQIKQMIKKEINHNKVKILLKKMMIESKHLKENKSMRLNLIQKLMHLALNHKKIIYIKIETRLKVIKRI